MKVIELNEKIKALAESFGLSSSRFADFVEIPRPIMSHIIAGRNKASLEIIQKIVSKFPELGLEWTYDGNKLDAMILKEIAHGLRNHELVETNHNRANRNGMGFSQMNDLEVKTLEKIVIFYDDNSFKEYLPTGSTNASVTYSKSISKRILKMVVFFSDNSFSEFDQSS